MTSNFDKHGPSHQRQAVSQSSLGQNAPAAALDNLKRDRFELLSAYLDGEVTVNERRQVEQWLETDQHIRCLYSRLLKLRQGMRTMAVPVSERSVEQTIESVYKKVDRSPKVAVAWVGAALALLAIPLFSSGLNPRLQFNKVETVDPATSTNMEIDIDLNTPILGGAASGTATREDIEKQLQDISKNNVMLQLDKSVVPIPEVSEDSLPQENEDMSVERELVLPLQ